MSEQQLFHLLSDHAVECQHDIDEFKNSIESAGLYEAFCSDLDKVIRSTLKLKLLDLIAERVSTENDTKAMILAMIKLSEFLTQWSLNQMSEEDDQDKTPLMARCWKKMDAEISLQLMSPDSDFFNKVLSALME